AAFLGSASGKITIGFLPPSSRLTRLSPAAASLAMARPVGTEPTKPIRLTSGWRTSSAPTAPSPVMMLMTPSGNMPSHSSPNPQARQRRLLRAFDHNGIAGNERRRRFFGTEAEGMVERVDLGHHAERLPPCKIEMALALRERLPLDFGHKPGAIAQPIHGPDHVCTHADNGIARIDGIDQRQRIGFFLDAAGKTFKSARPLFDLDPRPMLERRLGGLDGFVDVRFAGGWNVRELFHIRGIDRNKGFILGRGNPAAADIEAARGEIELWRLHGSCSNQGTTAARNTLRSAAL